MDLRITVLSENTATYGFLAEWGLCLLVEVDGMMVMMDTGLGTAAIHNAQLLGVDLTRVDKIVISHGHADHTGGLREMLRRKRGPVEVIAHPSIWESKYTRRPNERERYAGIPFPREELESLGARFTLTTQPVELAPGVWTTGEVSQEVAYEDVAPDLYLKQGDTWVKDPLRDDLALVLKTPRGLVVVPGCAHRGIVNTLHQARRVAGDEPIYAVLGGTHLFRASAQRIEQTVADLLPWGIQHLGVCHCTGFRACARLADALGDVFFMNNAGNRWRPDK